MRGVVIPAHPLVLKEDRRLDERRQKALTRYYIDAGSGGVAVGVHTTQFEIRDPAVGLFEPVLQLAADVMDAYAPDDYVRIAGICGPTAQALGEARISTRLGYHAGLLSLAAMKGSTDQELINHCRHVAEHIPIIGFYLQPSVGGRNLSYEFWRLFMDIPNVVAIKIAPFNRYQTIDVVRALQASGRTGEIALYTGNDDAIVPDLVSSYQFSAENEPIRFAGGLLGHWAVWTRPAVAYLRLCQDTVNTDKDVPASLLRLGNQITDSNAAFFDPSHGFAGCIAGINEVLRRQGLMAETGV